MSDNNPTTRPVVVGKKPVANYALAIQARLGEGATSVVLRARGQNISKAVDAANMALKFGLSLCRGELKWGEEAGPKGKAVSFIELTLESA